MKLSAFLTFLALTCEAYAVNCNQPKNGQTWEDEDEALLVVDKLCRERFVGNFHDKQLKKACVWNDKTNQYFYFHVKHIKKGDRHLPFEECLYGLGKQVRLCEHGGTSSYTNWEYKGIPTLKCP
ncbi:hypothetical protein F5B20DRAFT_536157 [Whalleya microplaca]|nr:hypothetical protein F5B20DRAFT_536157 [Whalleya microplaca]